MSDIRLARVRLAGVPTVVHADAPGRGALATVGGQSFRDLPGLLAAEGEGGARIDRGAGVTWDEDSVLSIVGQPPKIVGVGVNYRDHASETGRDLPAYPLLFPKWAVALTGPFADVPLPPETTMADWEAEVAVVIGRRCRRVAKGDVDSVVLGFSAANDVSMRDFQRHTSQFTAGKTWDASTPLGPLLVGTAALGGVDADLAVTGTLNGETVQRGHARDMVFSVRELVAYLSTIMTLEPGDVVLTGTPAGVGAALDPPRFLGPGDVFEVTVDGVGTLRNRFVSDAVTDQGRTTWTWG